jgi:flagellar hook protein FlgE
MYTAVSGMNANGTSLSVIGDNIANLNTAGFKGSRVSFGDVLSQTLAGVSGSSQVGRGVMVSGVTPLFTQGSFETTANGLDLAVDGDGFFMVNESGARYYTRAGQFSIDKNGNVVNPDGLALQGYLADAAGNITGTVGQLQIAVTQSPANMSTQATVAVNLDATATVPAAAFTLDNNADGINNDPANYNSSNSITVYDSQGGAHQVTQYFVKTAANAWAVHYVHDDPAAPGELVDAGTQVLTFDVNGALVNDNSGAAINFTFGGAVAAPQPISFNYGTGTGEAPAGNGLDGTTQFASPFSVMNLTQNGYASGSLQNISISEDGIITGVFSNGQTRAIGQVALARFIAPTGLTKLGRNLYAESFDSGQPIVGMASTSGIGRVLSNSLELSNVDLAEEFVKMISAQRAFQANSRIITTTDEMMSEIVNMKR